MERKDPKIIDMKRPTHSLPSAESENFSEKKRLACGKPH